MAKTAAGKGANIFVWILLGLLFVGLAGFGTGQFGGSVNSVGEVDGRNIDVNDYARALQQDIRVRQQRTGQPVTMAQAQAFGIPQNAMGQLVATAALDNEAARLGVSVGDDMVRDRILAQGSFTQLDGTFDPEVYERSLRQIGMTVPQYEKRIREEAARSLLQAAVAGGVSAPVTAVDTALDYLGEERGFSWLRIGPEALDAPLPEPTDADLRSFYSENEALYTAPEARQITYAWLTPEMLLDSVDVDEDILRAEYTARVAEFVIPERRLVERLVFPDEAAAMAAKERLDAGEISFDALVVERGLRLEDTDMGDVTEDDLGNAAETVFSLDGPGVAGPAPTSLGPALFRINGILAPQETSFEEAEPALRAARAIEEARAVIGERVDNADDLLAGGATVEDLAADTDFVLGTINFSSETVEGIAADGAFRRAAAMVAEGDFPEVLTLTGGGLFALRLDAIVEPALRPFDEVEEDVRSDWTATAIMAALVELAEAAATQLGETATLDSFGYDFARVEPLTRQGTVTSLPPVAVPSIFELAEVGQTEVLEATDEVYVLRLDSIAAPDEDDAEVAGLRTAIETELGQSMVQDVYGLFGQALQSQAAIQIDQAAINAVHAQFP
ncbi:MAG: SurA N-terminal domain-containing protein [Pseudomonadota bacterium]